MVSKTERLYDILAREKSKMGPSQEVRLPPVFRETLGDTHKTMQAEDFGAYYQNDPTTKVAYGTGRMSTRRFSGSSGRFGGGGGNSVRTRSAGPSAPLTGFTEGPVEFKSVFKPTPAQEHVCNLAKERRTRVANSEWALIDTLEVHLLQHDQRLRHEALLATQAAQRGALDRQMMEKAKAVAREEAEVQLEKRVAAEEIARFRKDESNRLQNKAQVALTVKRDRERMIMEARRAKEQEEEANRAEGAKELQIAQLQVEEDKANKAAKIAAAKLIAEDTRKDTAARYEARKAAKEQQKAADADTMKQAIAMLDKQEKDRADRLRAIQETTAARASKAGTQMVLDAQAKAEREKIQMEQCKVQREMEYQALVKAEAEAKQRKLKDMLTSREKAIREKAAKAEAAQAEKLRDRAAVDAKAAAEAEAERQATQTLRGRGGVNKDFVRTQIQERERTGVLDDTGMSEAERRLNMRLLDQAQRIVGVPTQLSIRI